MTAVSDDLHLILRGAHIVAGFIGLALFWVPVFAKKGGRLHIRTGWAFACCAGFVGVTGLISSLWALLDMPSFAGPTLSRVPESDLPRALELGRFLFALLAFLSLWLLGRLWLGLRVVRTRDRHEALRTPLLLGLHAAVGLAALGLLAFAAWNLVVTHPSEWLPPRPASIYWIPLAISLGGLKDLMEDLTYVLRPRRSPMSWWYKHMECMLYVGVAFHTAFVVFGVHGLFGLRLPGPWQLLPWVVPTILGVPAIRLWVRAYRHRFGERSARGPAAPEWKPPDAPLAGGPAARKAAAAEQAG